MPRPTRQHSTWKSIMSTHSSRSPRGLLELMRECGTTANVKRGPNDAQRHVKKIPIGLDLMQLVCGRISPAFGREITTHAHAQPNSQRTEGGGGGGMGASGC